MQIQQPVVLGTFIKRYKRFLTDVELEDGSILTAHCPNTGSMKGCLEAGARVALRDSEDPKRKLRHTFQTIEVGDTWVNVDTGLPNALAYEAVEAGKIEPLLGYASARREVKYGTNSRIDLLLEGERRPPCYVEIKNVHLKRDLVGHEGAAEFPDSVTKRGAKHLAEMSDMVRDGARAVMVYLVQRGDCDHFRVAGDVDPIYAEALAEGMASGVEAICYDCSVGIEEITVARKLPLKLDEVPV